MAACNEPVQTTPSSILQLRPSLSKPLAHRDEATERYSPESPLQKKDQLGHAVSNSDPAKTLTRALDTIQSYVDAATEDRCETAPEQTPRAAAAECHERDGFALSRWPPTRRAADGAVCLRCRRLARVGPTSISGINTENY